MSPTIGAAPFSEAEKHATAGVGSSNPGPNQNPNQQSQSQAVTPAAKQRSCLTCRQRKVRCDKLSPCTNCRRADIPCVLPSTERPPRWARRLKQQQQELQQQQQQQQHSQQSQPLPALPQTTQQDPSNPTDVSAVLDRLRQLEALVRDLSAGNAPGTSAAPVSNTYTQPPVQPPAQPPASSTSRAQQPHEAAVPIGERFGRLILDDDTSKRSRYVSSGFWSTINDELDAVRRDTNSRAAAVPGRGGMGGYSDEEDDDDSDGVLSDNDGEHEAVGGPVPPGSAGASRSATAVQTPSGISGRTAVPEAAHRSVADCNAFFFGHNLQPPLGNAADYRPLPSQIPFLFQVYVVNVNMLSQIVHVPTINKIIEGLVGGTTNDIEKHRLAGIDAAISNVTNNNADETTGKEPVFELTPATEALMFAIYYAAVISMEEEDVVKNFGMPGAELSLKYRIGLELSLASADFLNTSDLEIVQALVIFLMLCRRYDSPRFVWMMTGLVIRMALALGLHRDGSNFGNSLSPYEVELRRRVWCAVCALDVRSSEDQGTDLTIMPSSYDTRFPLSINDSDIEPGSKETPRERDELTDMTYALLNFEVTGLAQRMMASAKQASVPNGAAGAPSTSSGEQFLQEQNRMLEEVHRKLESRYLRHSPDTSSVIYWTSVTITRLFMAKMTLILNLPRLLQVDKSSSALSLADEDLRTRLLSSAIDVAEYNDALKTEKACRRWRWLCETYTQWHTIAFLLMETGRRPWDPAVERAWAALHGAHLIPAPPKKKSKESKEPNKEPASQAWTQSSRAASISANSAGGASNSNSNSNKSNKSNKTSATSTSKTSTASENSQFFWLPLRRLMARARRHRASELARLRADTKAARDLEIAYDLAVADGRSRPSSNPAAVDAFRDRWRRLVGLDRADQVMLSSGTVRGSTLQSPASSAAPNQSTQFAAAHAADTSWDTSIRPLNNMLVGPSPSGPALNRFLDPRAPVIAALRNFSDLTEQEYKSPSFPGGQGTASMQAQPGQPSQPGQSGNTPAPNSIDEFILSTSGHTPKPDPLAAQRWNGFDPWQIWDGQGPPRPSRGIIAAFDQEAASRPDMGPTSGLPFVGVAGVDPVNMDFNVDFSTDPMTGQLLFDEDLDIDMDAEPNIDWGNWFESAKGF